MGCIKLDILNRAFTGLKVVYRNPGSDKKSAQRFVSVDPLPMAKDANGNTITNQETGEAIRPSVNAVEVHYTEPKDPMQFVSTLSPLPDLKNPYKAANIVPIIKGNFDVAPPSPQQFYFEKSASQEVQNYWKSFYAKFGYAHSNFTNMRGRVWDLNRDNRLGKREADIWWLYGNGKGITVDNSKIDWTGLKIPNGFNIGDTFGISTTQAFTTLPFSTAATYGGTSFKVVSLNEVMVLNQAYHYNYRKNNSFENTTRNFMTWFGKPNGNGKDFMIKYNNSHIKIK